MSEALGLRRGRRGDSLRRGRLADGLRRCAGGGSAVNKCRVIPKKASISSPASVGPKI